MSVAGLCQVCETAVANDQCERCGTLVCRDHYDDRLHLCVQCSRDTDGGPDTVR